MEKWIQNIKGTIPHTNTTVDIELNGKNLIITGANGSGKTSFLQEVYDKILLQDIDILDLKQSLEIYNQRKINGDFLSDIYSQQMIDAESRWHKIQNGMMVNIPNNTQLFSLYKKKTAIIRLYEEKRLSKIQKPKIGKQINAEDNKLGNKLEQHLVNLKTRASLSITEDKNQALANKINSWFDDFESNLKILFEEENIRLSFKFEVDETGFEIVQKDKPPFSFQTLSAGYRAIFDIYADLLMHTEYFKIMPNELTGVVFIDEIDSHLHISLQRLILPFFTQSFPKIQFIVTTHSPFVLMSTPGTVIFDLAKNEPITEDLSYYTYSAVMGLWNVKPIAAWVEQKIKKIETIVNSENKDIQQLKKLIEEVKGREDGLDSESRVIYLRGKQTLLREEQADV